MKGMKMRLSRKKAIELCIELWTWLAKTGREKEDWPRWKIYGDYVVNDCWFCEYSKEVGCSRCPLEKKFSLTCGSTFYGNWTRARFPRTRKKYAKLFLEQIKQTV